MPQPRVPLKRHPFPRLELALDWPPVTRTCCYHSNSNPYLGGFKELVAVVCSVSQIEGVVKALDKPPRGVRQRNRSLGEALSPFPYVISWVGTASKRGLR